MAVPDTLCFSQKLSMYFAGPRFASAPRPQSEPSSGRMVPMAAAALNPYAGFLGSLNPREIIANTPHTLIRLEEQLGAADVERSYAPGKWTARQIFCHLADCEIAFAFRLRQAAAAPNHVIQPFDQDAWSRVYDRPEFHAHTAVQVFAAVRGWNLVLIESLPSESLSLPVTHPERGAMTFSTILETMAGHDLNHLGQLQTIASQR